MASVTDLLCGKKIIIVVLIGRYDAASLCNHYLNAMLVSLRSTEQIHDFIRQAHGTE